MGHASDGGLTMEYPYLVFNPSGQPIMGAPESCRYPSHIELDMLEVGYTIRLHGKKITKTELRKENNGNNQRKPQRRI